jgi:outer membrane protein TolC
MTLFYWERALIVAILSTLTAGPQFAAEPRNLTLTEAVQLALAQNRTLRIARLRVKELEQKKAGEHSDYFPTLTNQSTVWHFSELQQIEIPAGALGIVSGTAIPAQGISVAQGKQTLVTSGTMLAQPLTQLIRVHQRNLIAAAEAATSRAELKKAENQVALQAHTLYYGILIARLQKQAAEQQTAYAGERLRESEDDIRNGSALKVTALDGRAGLLQSQQGVLTADLQLSDLTAELNDLLGLPLNTQLLLDPAVPQSADLQPCEEYVKMAWAENPEIRAAEESTRKAKAAVAAAQTAYIPDVTAFARYSYQNGVPLYLTRNWGTFGVNLNWDIFDFGKRRAAVRERNAQLAQAEENVRRLKEDVAVTIQRTYNKVERTRNMVQVANQVVKLRQESERLAENQRTQGAILVSDRRQATAASYQAQADFLQADLGYLLACAELQQAVGRTPGLY